MTQEAYYYSNAARQQIGPVSLQQLQKALLAPNWYPKAMIWREGWEQWVAWPQAVENLGLRGPESIPSSSAPPPIPEGQATSGSTGSEPGSSGDSAARSTAAQDNLYAPPTAALHDRLDPNELILDYAPFLTRFAAWIVDRIVLAIVFGIGFALIAILLPAVGSKGSSNADALLGLAMIATAILIPSTYFIYFEQSASGATPGKKLLGIRVTDLAGQRISLGASFVRTFIAGVSNTFYNVGHLVALFTERNQAAHDLAASTIVIFAKPRPEFVAGGANSAAQSGRRGAGSGLVALLVIGGFALAIIAIIAAIALPAYQDFTHRTQIMQTINDTAELRDQISSYQDENEGRCPRNDEGPFGPASSYQGKFHDSIELGTTGSTGDREQCVTLITIANTRRDNLDGKILNMAQSFDGTWHCNESTVHSRYLPRTCRNNAPE